MKKLLMLVLVTILMSSLLLVACGTPAPETPATPETPEPAPTPKPESKLVATVDNPLELNYSYHAPVPASMTQAIFIPWANDLETACGGRVKIIHHAGGALLSPEDAYDGVLQGICDIAQIAADLYPGQFPLSVILQLPFIYDNTEIAGIASHEILNKYCVDTELKDIKLMITAPLHPMHYLGNREVKVLEDFQGLKIRGSGFDAKLIRALGGTPVDISTGDVFSALDTGLVDATFFTWGGALAFGVIDVTKYRTACAPFLSVFHIHMNRQVYERLPDDIKKIFDEFSTVETSRKYAAAHLAMEATSKSSLELGDKRRGNEPIYVLPPEEWERWKEATQVVRDDWVAEQEEEGRPGQAMLDDMLSLVEKYSQQ